MSDVRKGVLISLKFIKSFLLIAAVLGASVPTVLNLSDASMPYSDRIINSLIFIVFAPLSCFIIYKILKAIYHYSADQR